MSFFVKSTPAPVAKTKDSRHVAVAVAVVLLLFVICQLAAFVDFPAVVGDFWLPGANGSSAFLVALLLVLGELAAIPFLLRWRLSPAMRVVSMAAGWSVVSAWLFILIWLNLTGVVGNSGLLGAAITVAVDWNLVFIMAAIGILTAWATWGLWPFGRSARSTR